MIASVRLVFRTSKQVIKSVAYVRDPRLPPNQPGFVSVVKLRDDRDYAQECLDAEVTRIQALLERARELATILDLREELETALKSILVLHSRSRRGPAGMAYEERPEI